MKEFTCWVNKTNTTDSMPHGIMILRGSHLAEAKSIFAALDVTFDGLDLWSDTTREMKERHPLVHVLPVVVTGNEWVAVLGDRLSIRVWGANRAEVLANAFELAAWMEGTGLRLDAHATLAQPEWQNIPPK